MVLWRETTGFRSIPLTNDQLIGNPSISWSIRVQRLRRHPLQWRHNEHDGVTNHQPHECLLNRLFRRRSKERSKLCVTGLWGENTPATGEFPAQRASNAENVSLCWRHHAFDHRVAGVCAYRHDDLLVWIIRTTSPCGKTSHCEGTCCRLVWNRFHWNGNVFILAKFSSLADTIVVIITTFGDKNYRQNDDMLFFSLFRAESGLATIAWQAII